MATTGLAIGPWQVTVKLSASLGMAFSRRNSKVFGCLKRSPEALLAEGANDQELSCLNRPVNIDEARRKWQSEAGLLGIRP